MGLYQFLGSLMADEGHFYVVYFVIVASQVTQGFIFNYKISGFFFSFERRIIHWKVENSDSPIHFGEQSK